MLPSSPLFWRAHVRNDTQEKVQEKRSDSININRGGIHLNFPFLKILKFPQLHCYRAPASTNQHSTIDFCKTSLLLQTEAGDIGISRCFFEWCWFGRRKIALSPWNTCWISPEYVGPGGRGSMRPGLLRWGKSFFSQPQHKVAAASWRSYRFINCS